MTSVVTISTSPANRKEIAQAFGQNQSAVRRIETLTRDVTVNLPDAVDTTNAVAAQALALAQALQQVAYVLTSPSSEVPNADSLTAGAGISITVGSGSVTISLKIPVTVTNGGTGLTTMATHGVAIGNGSSPPNFAVPTSADYVLTDNGPAADPSFRALPATVSSLLAGTGIAVSSSTGSVTVSLQAPVAVANGGTGADTGPSALTNLGAAKSGANSDITSLSGLTTALSIAQGGTGANSAAAALANLGAAALSGAAFTGGSSFTAASAPLTLTNSAGGGFQLNLASTGATFQGRLGVTTAGALQFGNNNIVSLTLDGSGNAAITGGLSFAPATTATAPAAGGGGALPATPTGYATVTIGGTARKIPYY